MYVIYNLIYVNIIINANFSRPKLNADLIIHGY